MHARREGSGKKVAHHRLPFGRTHFRRRNLGAGSPTGLRRGSADPVARVARPPVDRARLCGVRLRGGDRATLGRLDSRHTPRVRWAPSSASAHRPSSLALVRRLFGYVQCSNYVVCVTSKFLAIYSKEFGSDRVLGISRCGRSGRLGIAHAAKFKQWRDGPCVAAFHLPSRTRRGVPRRCLQRGVEAGLDSAARRASVVLCAALGGILSCRGDTSLDAALQAL